MTLLTSRHFGQVIDAIHKYTMQNVYAREQKYPPVLIISYETFRIHHKR